MGWRAPDHCVVPAASGELVTKIWKGLQEFEDLGLIDKVKTRVHLAQAEGCSPIVEAFEVGTTQVRPVRPNTIVKSLAIGNPASGRTRCKRWPTPGEPPSPRRRRMSSKGSSSSRRRKASSLRPPAASSSPASSGWSRRGLSSPMRLPWPTSPETPQDPGGRGAGG